MKRFAGWLAFSAFWGTGCAAHEGAAAAVPAPAEPMVVQVDARDAPQMMLHAKIRVPAKGGPLTLVYPKWVPGTHGPTNKVADISGLRFFANGQPLAWRRDPVETSEFSMQVPAGARAVDVELDVVVDTRWGATADVSDLNWNRVLVYPRGVKASDLRVDASVRMPEGWHFATALARTGESSGDGAFARVSLETLVDSPLIMGRYGRTFDLGNALGAEHSLELIASSREELEADDVILASLRHLVVEATTLFGARHYGTHYTFLLTLNCPTGSGLEHMTSNQSCEGPGFLHGGDSLKGFPWMLPHEFAHAWNGKYRRPRGLATSDYQTPMRNDLLWVYEGLTEYLGWVLATRSGLASVQDAKDWLASWGAMLDSIPSRRWRSVGDTAYTNAMGESSRPWYATQRHWDYMREGLFIWLEADTVIRQRTGGARSLDDFVRSFFGGANTGPEMKPYDLPDVIGALNAVAPYDWRGFFEQRVYTVSEHAALGGITGSGWTLAYGDTPNAQHQALERMLRERSARSTLGMVMSEQGTVTDLHLDGPAARAGVVVGATLVAVNGRKYTPEVLRRAISDNKGSTAPIELLTERDGFYRTIPVVWAGGVREPYLARDAGKPDLLASILAPHAERSRPGAPR